MIVAGKLFQWLYVEQQLIPGHEKTGGNKSLSEEDPKEGHAFFLYVLVSWVTRAGQILLNSSCFALQMEKLSPVLWLKHFAKIMRVFPFAHVEGADAVHGAVCASEVEEQVGFSQCLLQGFRGRMQSRTSFSPACLLFGHSLCKTCVTGSCSGEGDNVVCVCDAQRG